MKNFWMLYKIALKSNVMSSSSAMGISSRRKKLSGGITLGILFLVLTVYMFFMAYNMGEQLEGIAQSRLLLTIGIMGGNLFILLNCAFAGFPMIYKAKDYEFLSALPLSHKLTLTSKMAASLTMAYLYLTPVYIPFVSIYFVFEGVRALGVIFAIIGFLISPLLVFVIGITVGLLIDLITKRLKIGKILYVILMLAFVLLAMVIPAGMMNLTSYLSANGNKLFAILNMVYYPMKWLIEAITVGNGLSLLFFILVNLLPAAVLVFVSAKFYVPLVTFLTKSSLKTKTAYKEAVTQKVLPALMKKEIKRLTSSVNYLINSCLGPALFLILSILSLFKISFLAEGQGGNPFSIMLLSGAFLLLISSPEIATVSLEGETFWVLKSLPVKPMQIYNAKLLMQLVIFVPLTLVAVIIFSISTGFAVGTFFASLFFYLGVNLYGATFGLFIGTKRYNLHYTNEMMVIKQSSGVFIYMLVNVIVSVASLMLYTLLLSKFISLAIYLAVLGLAFLAAGVAFYVVLKNKATEESFNAIE